MDTNDLNHFVLGKVLLNRFTLHQALKPHVFVALDSESSNTVVLKYAPKEQLQREWNSMKQCSSPYVIEPLARFESLLILPYIEGQSLLAFTLAQTSLFIDIMPQIAKAIHNVHQSGWVHGDIKPSNVLYSPKNRLITLIDFGAARPVNTPLSMLDEWQLTPGFSSSIKHEGVGTITAKDDWYALKKWLAQIDDASLSSKDKHRRMDWTRWLGKQC